jgi:hypothetical protein
MAMNSSFPMDRPGSNTAFILGAVGGSPVERGQPVFSSGLAAGVLKMDDQVEEVIETDEHDAYYKMLTLFGRSEEDDQRIAVHESGHAVAARLLGTPLGGASINPDENGKYGGLVWGPGYRVAYGDNNSGDRVSQICEKLREAMPKDGEPRGDAADVYLHALNRCIELAAAASAERMLLPGDPVPSVSDVEHTLQYAALVCRSPEAARKFIGLAEQMADDLLRPYGHVIIALSVVLKIRRTLTGAEIDDVIKTIVAGFEVAAEHRRRAEWRQRERSASSFAAEYGHAGDSAVPYRDHDPRA